jgi:hypothetical protein
MLVDEGEKTYRFEDYIKLDPRIDRLYQHWHSGRFSVFELIHYTFMCEDISPRLAYEFRAHTIHILTASQANPTSRLRLETILTRPMITTSTVAQWSMCDADRLVRYKGNPNNHVLFDEFVNMFELELPKEHYEITKGEGIR